MKSIILTSIISLILIAVCLGGIYILKANSVQTTPKTSETGQTIQVAGKFTDAQSKALGINPETPLQEEYHPISIALFVGILIVQLFALFTASIVIHKIRISQDQNSVKLKKLENADIFLDLPLYAGLFGTVASFIIMTVNPQASRLIAYSSTIIGIIISVALRTILLFPYRQQLLTQPEAETTPANEPEVSQA
jgi:hypothetical protein